MATVVRKGKYSVDDRPDVEMELQFQTVSNHFTIIFDGDEEIGLPLEAMACLINLVKQMDHRIEIVGIV